MADDDVEDRIERLMAERARAPFGDTVLAAGRTLQPFSRASHQIASNLLGKAVRAVQGGDREKARRYVERAARLPFDGHEEELPLAGEAHMMLFNLITDELEESDAGDSAWLHAAVEVLVSSDEAVRCEVRDVLTIVEKEYELTRPERLTLRAAIADVPARPELRELAVDGDELVEIALSLIDGCLAYVAAVRRR
ncbi:MAG TPA: hypothetical protein VJ872_16280 [Nocardioides sp.]|nr:hypothetical protein [Nocardioides sp.]